MLYYSIFCTIFLLPYILGYKVFNGSLYCKERECNFKASVIDKVDSSAYGVYNDSLLDIGWSTLDLVAGYGPHQLDANIMYSAGFLEGILTARSISQHIQNIRDVIFRIKDRSIIEEKLKEYFNKQDKWMRSMIEDKSPQDGFWRHVYYILSQLDGLIAGYQAARELKPSLPKLEEYDFQMLNSNGDIFDLINIVHPEAIPDWRKMNRQEAVQYVHTHGRCSAMVKVLGAYENIYMSHSTWFNYGATYRIFKHWNFNIRDTQTSSKRLSFSSYPGFLISVDDFYILSSKMVMLQTTNNLFNKTLYKYCKPESLLAWHRVRIANMMANSGKQWAVSFSRYNSGTYNNQYMIVDLKNIHLNKAIEDNALWIIEQIPGLVSSTDVTPILRTGYWPSYNVPFFEEVYNKSGYPEFVAKHGIDLSYQLAPRAKIFRRDEGKVTDLETFKHIMRYNDFKTDPYSESDPCNSVCCRGDLEKSPNTMGCYDTKVTDFKMALNLQADVINGPTLGSDLPPFKWTSEFNQSHVGLPSFYNFSFIPTTPRWN
ncbi:hypothetical protein LOTGIDRAFT_205711 [Lottia gigantea]|uniref:Phospholipase B-like n=1 Tax=Lottia gigantea TaxID=225164 RepID=V4A1Y1_LOTGI|nr:hypothetical protein LOTGIDRAFT_205711 [Lottia gigantea]ESO88915.1 hypothetical protein LOTGIDRAFT_205711 [Lottia gigantea]